MTDVKPMPGRRVDGRVRLSRDVIIASALELAAQPGVEALRIRDLGRELGVDPSAIYRHFQSKNELMTALVETLGNEILARVDTSPERDWRAVLEDIAEEGLQLYLQYPAIGAEGASIATESTDIVEQILAALHRGGLRGEQLVRHYTLFASYALSFSGAIARSRVEYEDGLSDRPWAEDVRSATALTHPTASRYREQILALSDIDVFRSGIAVILDAAAAAAR